MFDNTNPYTLRTESTGNNMYYYITFTDGQAAKQEVKVSQHVYEAFEQFVKTERNLQRWCERHEEWYELPEGTLHDRAVDKPQSAEDAALINLRDETLRNAIYNLPEVQRRRFLLRYEFGFTYKRITAMEGCTKVSAYNAVMRAVEKIHEEVNFFQNEG